MNWGKAAGTFFGAIAASVMIGILAFFGWAINIWVWGFPFPINLIALPWTLFLIAQTLLAVGALLWAVPGSVIALVTDD